MKSSASLRLAAFSFPLSLQRGNRGHSTRCTYVLTRYLQRSPARSIRSSHRRLLSSPPIAATANYKKSQQLNSKDSKEETTVDDDEDDSGEDDPSLTETFRVSRKEHGERIDKAMAERYGERSRTYVQKLLSSGCVRVNGHEKQSKSFRLTENDVVTVKFTAQKKDVELTGENIPLDILYEDAEIAVVNKPAGMVVHPSPGHWSGTLVHALCYRYPKMLSATSSQHRPGIVHRLDKGTSGAIVIAKTEQALLHLGKLFSERQVHKEYVAITVGNPCGKSGREMIDIEVPIGRNSQDRMKMIVDTPLTERYCVNSKQAKTSVQTLSHDAHGLLHVARVILHTGRTHQIRIHLHHANTPILGDDLYGRLDINKRFMSSAQRPMLHAHLLQFPHPIMRDQTVRVTAPLPDDMVRMMRNVVYPDFEPQFPNWYKE